MSDIEKRNGSESPTTGVIVKAKTLDQVIAINTGLAKTGVETLLDRSAKLSQWSLALAKEATLPLEQCFETTLAKLTKQQAA